MSRRFIAIVSLLISLLFVSVIWQFAETFIHSTIETAWGRLTGRPFNQIRLEDERGIPMQLYSTGEKHYNPLFIANEAKDEYFLRENPQHAERFILLTDWLLEHGVETDSTFYLNYDFDYPQYEMKAPWQSALAQAVAMNALAHRASYERDLVIYGKAIKALNTLRPEVGHISLALSDSTNWYMEYPASEPHYVLNGMMGVLFELNYYRIITKDPLAKELFDKGYRALLQRLPEFDYSGYSYYDLMGTKAGRMYHKKHIAQLKRMNDIAPSPILQYYLMRWRRADSYPVLWQMVMNPRPKRLLAFFLPFFGLWGISFVLLGGTRKTGPEDPEHS